MFFVLFVVSHSLSPLLIVLWIMNVLKVGKVLLLIASVWLLIFVVLYLIEGLRLFIMPFVLVLSVLVFQGHLSIWIWMKINLLQCGFTMMIKVRPFLTVFLFVLRDATIYDATRLDKFETESLIEVFTLE